MIRLATLYDPRNPNCKNFYFNLVKNVLTSIKSILVVGEVVNLDGALV